MTSEVSLSMQSQGKSETSVTQTRAALMSSQGIDFVFPLLEQSAGRKPKLTWISELVRIYCCIQFVFLSFWPLSNIYQKSNTTEKEKDILKTIISIVFFSKQPDEKVELILFIVVLAITLFSFFWFALVLYIFRKNNQFVNWTLDVSQFLFEAIVPFGIIPAAISAHYSLHYLIKEGKQIYWAFFIFSLIFYISLFLAYSRVYVVQCKGVYMSKSLYGSFEPNAVLLCFLSSVCTILCSLFETFPMYFKIAVFVFHILIFIGSFYFITQMPFHKRFSNILFAGIALACIATDVSFIILTFIDAPAYIPYIVCLVAFVAGLIIFGILFDIKTKKIVAAMSMKPGEVSIDYDDLLLQESRRKLLMYLCLITKVRWEQLSPKLLNWPARHLIVNIQWVLY